MGLDIDQFRSDVPLGVSSCASPPTNLAVQKNSTTRMDDGQRAEPGAGGSDIEQDILTLAGYCKRAIGQRNGLRDWTNPSRD